MASLTRAGEHLIDLMKELYSYTKETSRSFDFKAYVNKILIKVEQEEDFDEDNMNDLILLIDTIDRICEIDYKILYLSCKTDGIIEKFILNHEIKHLDYEFMLKLRLDVKNDTKNINWLFKLVNFLLMRRKKVLKE